MNLKKLVSKPFTFKRETAQYTAMIQDGRVVAYYMHSMYTTYYARHTYAINELYDDTDMDISYLSTTAHISIKDIAKNHRVVSIRDGRNLHE